MIRLYDPEAGAIFVDGYNLKVIYNKIMYMILGNSKFQFQELNLDNYHQYIAGKVPFLTIQFI
jgi:ABC-type transport system involved in Fe-S cluster assembly fused permease/ATPase subunit